jgi:hypothetical protein
LSTLLILFGAGVEASDCASACGEPADTGRWIVGLSLIIFLLPLLASPSALLFFRWLLTPLTERKPHPVPRRSILSRLMG